MCVSQTPVSIMLADYPQGVSQWDDATLESEYDYLQAVVTAVR